MLQHLYDRIPKNFHFVAEYAVKKQELAFDLKEWQKKINLISKGLPMIVVENEVDLEVLCFLFFFTFRDMFICIYIEGIAEYRSNLLSLDENAYGKCLPH